MKRLLFLPLVFIGGFSFAQISINGASSYSQNFDVLPTSGTGNAWTDNSTISGWYAQRASGTNAINAGDGTSNTGAIYSFGTGTATERALGSICSSGTGAVAYGIEFNNTGTTTLGTFTVSYTMEQWRNGGNTSAQPLNFYYKVGSTAITTLNPGSSTGWNSVSALSATSPVTGSTAAALDGNSAVNRQTFTTISIPGLILNPGEFLVLKWDDINDAGNDHGLSVDDVNISWSASCVTSNTISASSCESYTVPSGDETYTVSGTYMDTIPNAAMCDSIITINLTIKHNTTNTISPTACGSYTVPSGDETYTASGTYMDTIPNAAGCDSVLTINLTISTSITYYLDSDNDGFGDPANSVSGCSPIPGYVTNSDDCDDSNASIGVATTMYYTDNDNDGFGDASTGAVACVQPPGTVTNGDDCDDNDNMVGAPGMWYADNDNDGFGAGTGMSACTQPVGYVADNTDCNDNDNTIYPGATEIPDNGIDEDCDGSDLNTIGSLLGLYEFTNNSCTNQVWGVTAQPTNATFADYDTLGGLACASGTGYINYSNWNMATTVNTDQYYSFGVTPDNCYGLDLNRIIFLHKTSSTGGTPIAHLRSSLDNFASDIATKQLAGSTAQTDTINLGATFDNVTTAIEFRWYITEMGGSGATYRQDNVSVYGNINALPQQTYYADVDGDSFGDAATSVSDCTQPAGYVLDNTDCNDTDANQFPGAVWYADTDNDGLGDAGNTLTQCTQPAGYVSDNTDCNDNDNQVGAMVVYYVDVDNDGFGDANDAGVSSCTPITGAVTNADDCDDSNTAVNPSATEICDGLDNNCDGNIDEGLVTATYYQDADNDGYGNPNMSMTDCTQPNGYVTDNTDCDDTNNAIHPGAADASGDGIDQNCDGVDGVLGLNELAGATLNVFPNPGSEAVTIQVTGFEGKVNVTVVSAEGKVVISNLFTLENGNTTLSTSDLTSGVYMIRVATSTESAIVRWIKK